LFFFVSPVDNFEEGDEVLLIHHDEKLFMFPTFMICQFECVGNNSADRAFGEIVAEDRSDVRKNLSVTIQVLNIALKSDGLGSLLSKTAVTVSECTW